MSDVTLENSTEPTLGGSGSAALVEMMALPAWKVGASSPDARRSEFVQKELAAWSYTFG